MSITITVKNTSGARFEMDIPSLSETVADFKTRLAAVVGIPAASQRLIFRGHILKDTHTFADIKNTHGLESGHSMHVVPSPAARTSSQSSGSGATATNAPSGGAGNQGGLGNAGTGTGATQGMGTNPGGFGGGGMFGGGGNAGGGWPDMMEMQQQLLRNPQQMQRLMNSPMMESIMNNPQVARSIMMANPQMRELLERNPEVAHVFNDPATFRQMMQMARNPSLMNEMMRNTDRQMANIEMMPGGFDALRRMHENIQAPLMDATQGLTPPNGAGGGANNNGGDDNPFTSLFQQNTRANAPMPNPWAPAGGNGGAQAQAPRTTPSNGAPRGGNTGGEGLGNAFAPLFQEMAAGGGNAQPQVPGAMNAPIPGLEGLGMPNLTADQMWQMMENPMMQQMMQSILADPQMLQSIIARDPHIQARLQSNPEMARILQNPELMRTFLNPEVLQGMRQIQNALAGMNAPGGGTGTQTGGTPTATGGVTTPPGTQGTPGANAGTGTAGGNPAQHGAQNGMGNGGAGTSNSMDSFFAMMNALAGANGGAAPAPEMTQEQLEEMYSSQLQQLREMGFLDKATCLQALQQSRGNVSAAIENLLSRFGG